MVALQDRRGIGFSRAVQDLQWEYLLCFDCEQLIGRYEARYKRMWDGIVRVPAKMKPNDEIHVQGLDASLFRLYHVSLLFRASISSRISFKRVNLGPLTGIAREILLRGDDGPMDRFTIAGMVMTDDDGVVIPAVMYPERYLNGSARSHFYQYAFDKFYWVCCVSRGVPKSFAQHCLKPDGSIRLLPNSIRYLPIIRDHKMSRIENKFR